MTLYDRMYEPPGWTRVLGGVGWLLSIWFALWPWPFAPLLIILLFLPLLHLYLIARWPPSYTSESSSEWFEPSGGMSGLWSAPVIAIASRGIRDTYLLDIGTAAQIGCGAAVLLASTAAVVSRRARSWRLIGNLIVGLAWGWGGSVLVNAEFDRTPGVVQVAEVTGRDDPEGEPEFDLRLKGADAEDISGVSVDYALFNRTPLGGEVCVEVNPGLFGWRLMSLADCTRPLQTLGPIGPGPGATSP